LLRKIISVVLYVLAGFFVYAACFASFIGVGSAIAKILCLAGIFSVAMIFMCIAASLHRFEKWKMEFGVTLVSATTSAAAACVMLLCIWLDPEFRRYFPRDHFGIIDYVSGTVLVFFLSAFGVVLIRLSTRKPSIVEESS
jgi:hypothetical protein